MKKFFSKLAVFALTLSVMLLPLTACGENSQNSQSTQTPASTPSAFTPAVLDVFAPTWAQPETNYVEATEKTTLFLVGDSTVCEYTAAKEASSYYYMRNGYGMRMGEYLNENVTITNLALSGRSSKSFLAETNYTTLTNSIKVGDYLLIGFGHNDQKAEQARFADPTGGKDVEGSFKNNLYTKYIKIAQDAGATPILCTPIVRRSSSGTYSGAKIHQTATSTSGGVTYNGGDYAQAIIDLGAELNVPVIDLTTLTKNMLTGVPSSKSMSLYSWKFGPNTTSVDDTHLNAYGAQVVARLVCEELIKTDCSLKNYVKKEFAVPNSNVLVPSSAKK